MNPLDPILVWWTTAKDALRVTSRVLRKRTEGATPPGLIKDAYVFFDMQEDQGLDRIDAAKRELDGLVVLALVATFERSLREHVLDTVRGRFPPGNVFLDSVRGQIENDVEFWHFSVELIEAFASVAQATRDGAKQLVKFRDWVAHARHAAAPPDPPPVSAEPQMAYRRLTQFLMEAGITNEMEPGSA
jgi:hypothetical protein